MRFPLNFFARCLKQIRATAMVAVFSLIPTAAQPTEAKLSRPTPEQAAWHDCEIGVFVHVGPATWQDSEYDTLATPLEKINPGKLDTARWVATAETMGAKYLIFVAKSGEL